MDTVYNNIPLSRPVGVIVVVAVCSQQECISFNIIALVYH